MSNLRRVARSVLPVALAPVLWFAVSPVPAEVAVSVPGDGSDPTLYELRSIVDDPEPVGIVWQRYNVEGPGRFVLNDLGQANADGRPSLLVTSPHGTPVVAWSRNSANGYDVVLSRFENGAWTQPQLLASTGADEIDPVLIRNPDDGSIHLVYWIDDASPRVMHRQTPADLSSWSTELQVSQPDEPACRPSAVFHAGLLRVAYEVHDFGIGTAPRQIVLATRNGQEFSAQMLGVTLHEGGNWPQVHSAGQRLWVDWIDADGEMSWVRQLQVGVWDPIEIEPYDGPEDREYHVRSRIKSLVRQ